MKILLGCAPDERRAILAFHQIGQQAALLVPREEAGAP